jgi:CRP-like cAMP-binding protein
VRISQKASSDSEAEEALVILKKGDVFGEMAMLEDLPRSATTIAHTSVISLEISRDDFLNYIHKNSENGVKILLKLSRILSSRLRETDVKLKTFVSLSRWL